MAIVKQRVPYEHLVRYNADGTVRGQHIKYLDRIYDDETNEVYAERETNALSVGDESARVLLETALGQIGAADKIALAKEMERREAAERMQTDLSAALDRERSEKRDFERQLAVITASRDAVNEQLKQEREKTRQLEVNALERGGEK